MTYFLIINVCLHFSRWRITGQISTHDIPYIFAYLKQRGSWSAKSSLLFYLDNKTIFLINFRFFPIFQDSLKNPEVCRAVW